MYSREQLQKIVEKQRKVIDLVKSIPKHRLVRLEIGILGQVEVEHDAVCPQCGEEFAVAVDVPDDNLLQLVATGIDQELRVLKEALRDLEDVEVRLMLEAM